MAESAKDRPVCRTKTTSITLKLEILNDEMRKVGVRVRSFEEPPNDESNNGRGCIGAILIAAG